MSLVNNTLNSTVTGLVKGLVQPTFNRGTAGDNPIAVGVYVTYKDTTHVVVELRDGMAVILNPLKGNAKLKVALRNLVVCNSGHTCVVEYAGAQYIVTHKLLIISVKTGRIMKWSKEDAVYKGIISQRDGVVGKYLTEVYAEQADDIASLFEEGADDLVPVPQRQMDVVSSLTVQGASMQSWRKGSDFAYSTGRPTNTGLYRPSFN